MIKFATASGKVPAIPDPTRADSKASAFATAVCDATPEWVKQFLSIAAGALVGLLVAKLASQWTAEPFTVLAVITTFHGAIAGRFIAEVIRIGGNIPEALVRFAIFLGLGLLIFSVGRNSDSPVKYLNFALSLANLGIGYYWHVLNKRTYERVREAVSGASSFKTAGTSGTTARSAPIRNRVVDLYGMIGVAENATLAQIKTAFRKKAKTCHPDLFPNDKSKEAVFRDLKSAYDILANSKKRRFYDKLRRGEA